MKVISVRQPWAWLIIHGGKDVENRTWETKHRGPLAIHAGKRMDTECVNFVSENCKDVKIPWRHNLGGIIGVVNLRGVTTVSNSIWFQGPKGWQLSDPKPCAFFPCKGQLGLFDNDDFDLVWECDNDDSNRVRKDKEES